ncbi:hypothetical protein T11_5178 [Trichinella zimbabwensis]|uniref:Uncharacterized protein n=1 Tax=Trichinella zimbabwensis TaxID=268475 RepID=A0A0V1H561_9BILA|nr:hypothetical protein T11_5178 [Trichinella zimbabwensis]
MATSIQIFEQMKTLTLSCLNKLLLRHSRFQQDSHISQPLKQQKSSSADGQVLQKWQSSAELCINIIHAGQCCCTASKMH